jgi:hypothetical protein
MTFDNLLSACVAKLREQLEWHIAKAKKPYPQRTISAYSTGYEDGWRAAMRYARETGALKTTRLDVDERRKTGFGRMLGVPGGESK